MKDRNCQDCSKSLPEWAEFCPFCGAKYRATSVLAPVTQKQAPVMTEILFLGTSDEAFDASAEAAPVSETAVDKTDEAPAHAATNHEALEMFRPEPFDPADFEDPTMPRSRMQYVAVGVAAAILIGAFGSIAFLLSTTEEKAPIPQATTVVAKAAEKIVEESKPAPLPELLSFDVNVEGKEGPALVNYGDKTILQVSTAKGSRYDNVEQRARSISVRLAHIAKKQRDTRVEEARFVARVNGDRYEVVWDDGSKYPFRVTDVTRHDVDKKGDLAIEANLRADALTELFHSDIAPVSVPNT